MADARREERDIRMIKKAEVHLCRAEGLIRPFIPVYPQRMSRTPSFLKIF
jgi:hypothetical protein